MKTLVSEYGTVLVASLVACAVIGLAWYFVSSVVDINIASIKNLI